MRGTMNVKFTYEIRTALFWDITQRVVVILIDVSGLSVAPIFKAQ